MRWDIYLNNTHTYTYYNLKVCYIPLYTANLSVAQSCEIAIDLSGLYYGIRRKPDVGSDMTSLVGQSSCVSKMIGVNITMCKGT